MILGEQERALGVKERRETQSCMQGVITSLVWKRKEVEDRGRETGIEAAKDTKEVWGTKKTRRDRGGKSHDFPCRRFTLTRFGGLGQYIPVSPYTQPQSLSNHTPLTLDTTSLGTACCLCETWDFLREQDPSTKTQEEGQTDVNV